jgi:Tol biopolymer transport system component
MSRIFISYRRAESHAVTDRIYDHLSAQYGASALFKDVDNIPVGEQFPVVITEAIIQCAVVLVIIGPHWATITNETGQPRLHDPNDFVRQEVETGLRHHKRVIPILVEDASMPAPDDVPPSLRPLTERNAVTIRHDPYFREDMARLTAGIRESLGQRDTPAWLSRVDWRIVAGVALALLVVIVALIISRGGDSGSDGDKTVSGGEDGRVQIIDPGEVRFLPAGKSSQPYIVDDGQWISDGGALTTKPNTVVQVNYALGAYSRVMPSGWVRFDNIADTSESLAFTIADGELFVSTGKWPGAEFTTAEGARATVEGSEMWITNDQGTITTACFSGRCTVSDATNQMQDLDAGFMVTFDSAGGDLLDATYAPQPIQPSDITAYDNRCGGCVSAVSAPTGVGRVVFIATSRLLTPVSGFFAANTDGTDLVIFNPLLTDLFRPVWSPDGSQVAFAGSDGEGEIDQIYTLDADGSNLAQLTDLEYGATTPDWSPDGTQIVFESDGQIYIMDADGNNITQLTDDRRSDSFPAWSPDGNRIAFVSESVIDDNNDIIVMELDGWPRVNLTRSLDSNEELPAWSPDGSQIAFVSERDGNAEIYVMNADGSDPVNLTQHEAFDYSPVWLPDGQHIAFISSRDEPAYFTPYVMSADGSDVVPILEFWEHRPDLFIDYRFIFYLDWQPEGTQPLASVSIAPEALNAELAWRVATHDNWGEGITSQSGSLEVTVTIPDSDCAVSATYDRYVAYEYTSDMRAVSADNVTYDAQSDTFTVTLPRVFITNCKPPELELTEQSSTCPDPQPDVPDLDALARTQARMVHLQGADEELTDFENDIVESIEFELSSVTGPSSLVIVFDRTLSPPLPESCAIAIPDGWQYDADTGVWEPVAGD